jgi:hypothetical protein
MDLTKKQLQSLGKSYQKRKSRKRLVNHNPIRIDENNQSHINKNNYNQILTPSNSNIATLFTSSKVTLPILQYRCAYVESGTNQRCPTVTTHFAPFCRSHCMQIYKIYVRKVIKKSITMYGVFAYSPDENPNTIVFHKGDDICSYVGIINDELAQGNLFYTAEKNVNAERLRSIGSLINHSCRDENAKFVGAGKNKERFPIIRAIKPIRHNQEIFLNYRNKQITKFSNKPLMIEFVDLTIEEHE